MNRGSTWMIFAPRALASATHWKPTGWHSAMFEPSMMMQSELAMSCRYCVAPPRPNEDPRLGTVAECQIRAWFSIWIAPEAVKSFFIRKFSSLSRVAPPSEAIPRVRFSVRPCSSVSSQVLARVRT